MSFFGMGAGGAVVVDVPGGPMGPAVGDGTTVAVGALDILCLAGGAPVGGAPVGGAPVGELLFDFSDFSGEGVEGAVCIDDVCRFGGVDRRIGVVGVRGRLRPVLKNGV